MSERMKTRRRPTSPSHYSHRNETKMTFSKAEVREMVRDEVQNAKKQSQAKLDVLLETIQQLANDTHYECAMGKLEIQIEKLKRRADAAIDHVMKLDVNSRHDTPQLQIPLSSDAGTPKLKISRLDSGDESTRTASHSKHNMSTVNIDSTAVKDNGKLLQAMEATKNTMRMMRANNEALKITSTPSEGHSLQELPAVPVKKEMSVEAILGHYGVKKKEEQPVATKVKVEPLDEDESSPDKQEASVYPPLPATPFPSVLNMQAASYSTPPRLSLQLALIRNPPRLSVVWNAEEPDPSEPPMESYSVYMAKETDEGSDVFPEWMTLGVVKAIPLPMCLLISKFKPGFKVCFTVVGKDTFGRYGPYSKIVHAVIPDWTTRLPDQP